MGCDRSSSPDPKDWLRWPCWCKGGSRSGPDTLAGGRQTEKWHRPASYRHSPASCGLSATSPKGCRQGRQTDGEASRENYSRPSPRKEEGHVHSPPSDDRGPLLPGGPGIL